MYVSFTKVDHEFHWDRGLGILILPITKARNIKNTAHTCGPSPSALMCGGPNRWAMLSNFSRFMTKFKYMTKCRIDIPTVHFKTIFKYLF